MTFKKIIETAIERGWKGRKGNPMGYIQIDVEGRQVNLEDIETLKALCRVLWNKELAVIHAEDHLIKLFNLNSWKSRKQYIIKNFKQDE